MQTQYYTHYQKIIVGPW